MLRRLGNAFIVTLFCIHMCDAHAYMHVYVSISAYACDGLRLMSGVFLDASSPHTLRQGLLLNLETAVLTSLTSQFAPGISCLCLSRAGIVG